MTPTLFVTEMIVLVVGALVYGIARTGPAARARRTATVFEVPLPSVSMQASEVLTVVGLLLVPCGLIAILLWAILRYDLPPSDGFLAAGVAVPLIVAGAIQTGLRLRLPERFACGHLRIDEEALTWDYGAARGRLALGEPFVVKRALAMEPHRRRLYQVCTVAQGNNSLRFFYPATMATSNLLVWRWLDGTDGVCLGQHGTEVMERLKPRAERFEETPPGK